MDQQNKKRKCDLDKFYTNPEIAKLFVDKINSFVNLKYFDLVIEPSAGSGNILQYLPKNSIGLDLKPEGDNIIQKDFFKYYPKENIVACVGNPPFGTGYMNPLAKGFFNHAAKFSSLIAFIVPAKWHTSWKIHRQLDKSFGLYYSEILPEKSFTFNDKPYNVNSCMQIWSKIPLGKNLRIINVPPTKHEDFDIFLTCDKVSKTAEVREQIKKNEYWDFGLKYWGKICVCEIKDIPYNTTTHFVFSSKKPYVRKIFENINWTKYISNMGAPNIGGKSVVINAYINEKKELGIND